MNAGKQQVIICTAQWETQSGTPEIVSKAFAGYLIYPHIVSTKQKEYRLFSQHCLTPKGSFFC